MTLAAGGQGPVLNVPVGWADAHPAGPLIVRVTGPCDVSKTHGLPLDRVVWIEMPLALVEAPWPMGAPLDVVLEDPAREAAGLYALDRVRRDHPVRVTIPGRPGIARSARIAMALELPVRLLTPQPASDVLAELGEVLETYLHDSRATAPVEFLQSALAWSLFGDAPSPWAALEIDPDWYPRLGAGGAPGDETWPPREAGFVARRFTRLVEAGGACATCRAREWCRGFFKWPDPAYECEGVWRLLARIEESAASISQDLAEAKRFEP